jgi:hypothetical protein
MAKGSYWLEWGDTGSYIEEIEPPQEEEKEASVYG